VWSVAADKLWLHTADVLYLSAAMWLSANRYVGAGIGFGLAVLTRPHTAIIGAATAIGRGADKQSIRPVLRVGIGIGAGVGALLLFNYAVFGRVSVAGGYDLEVGQYLGSNGLNLPANIWGGFFDLSRGLLPLSPFLLVLLPGLPGAWRAAPNWVRGAALGGLSYYLVQLGLNRFSGGSGFWGYRYPIEMLVAAGPLLLLAYREWVAPRRSVLRIFIVALAISIGIHAAGALRCAQYVC
jgi:alpha-1,2-mannosyltransferase